jgi:hypothetical protein
MDNFCEEQALWWKLGELELRYLRSTSLSLGLMWTHNMKENDGTPINGA